MKPIRLCHPSPGEVCRNPATFNVWFEGCGGLYTSMCNKHVVRAMITGVNGYDVSQVSSLTSAKIFVNAIKSAPIEIGVYKFDWVDSNTIRLIRKETFCR